MSQKIFFIIFNVSSASTLPDFSVQNVLLMKHFSAFCFNFLLGESDLPLTGSRKRGPEKKKLGENCNAGKLRCKTAKPKNKKNKIARKYKRIN